MAVNDSCSGGRQWLLPIVLLGVLLTPGAVHSSDQPVSFEITWAQTSVDYSDEAAWGFWNINKYDSWLTPDEDESDVSELRFIIPGRTTTTFFAVERLPTILATGVPSETAAPEQHLLTAKLVTYDLALGQWFKPGDSLGLFPWAGVTSIRIEETRSPVAGSQQTLVRPADKAKSSLWGVAVGLDGELSLSQRLVASGRVVVRWAKGPREGRLHLDSTDGEQQVTTVTLSDSTKRAMYGAELGLRWTANQSFSFEGGWRYRDWQHDGGPAAFDGPYVRLIVDL